MIQCRGIRGAITVPCNTKDAILDATSELLTHLIEENALKQEDIVSILFSLTPDLDAEFPAVAARKIGLHYTPLLCLNEIAVPGSLSHCVRVLIHANSAVAQADIVHAYLRDAHVLRPDIKG